MTATQHPLNRDPSRDPALLAEPLLRDGSQAAALDEDTVIAAPGRTPWLRILFGLALLYAVFVLGAWAATRSPQPPPTGAFGGSGVGGAPPLLVHIAGRVRRPGVYSLAPSARVRDAIQKAGGALPDADINAVNLAAWIEDGTRIEVPHKPIPQQVRTSLAPPPLNSQALVGDIKSEIRQAVATELRDVVAQVRAEAARQSTASQSTASAGLPITARAQRRAQRKAARDRLLNSAPGTAALDRKPMKPIKAAPEYLIQHPINLNTATAEQLRSLPGVGPALAAKILAYRHEAKGFKAVDDLDNVPGIGERKLEKLRPFVTVK